MQGEDVLTIGLRTQVRVQFTKWGLFCLKPKLSDDERAALLLEVSPDGVWTGELSQLVYYLGKTMHCSGRRKTIQEDQIHLLIEDGASVAAMDEQERSL